MLRNHLTKPWFGKFLKYHDIKKILSKTFSSLKTSKKNLYEVQVKGATVNSMLPSEELMLMTLAPLEVFELFLRRGKNALVIAITPQTLVFMIWKFQFIRISDFILIDSIKGSACSI